MIFHATGWYPHRSFSTSSHQLHEACYGHFDRVSVKGLHIWPVETFLAVARVQGRTVVSVLVVRVRNTGRWKCPVK